MFANCFVVLRTRGNNAVCSVEWTDEHEQTESAISVFDGGGGGGGEGGKSNYMRQVKQSLQKSVVLK